VLADALGSVAVIISSIMIKYWGLYIADPICCFLISLLILASVIPLIKQSATTLILGTNGRLKNSIESKLSEVALPGNLRGKLQELQVWELASSDFVCSLKVNVGLKLHQRNKAEVTTFDLQ